MDGHHRVKAARELYQDTVPTTDISNFSRDDVEALFIELNYSRRQLTSKEKAKAAKKLREIIERQAGVRSKPKNAARGHSDLEVSVGEDSSTERRTKKKSPDKAIEKAEKEAAKRLGVGHRQFRKLVNAGSAPSVVVDNLDSNQGFTVKEAEKIGRAFVDRRTKDSVQKASEVYEKALLSGEPNQIEDSRKQLILACERSCKGFGIGFPPMSLKSHERAIVKRDPKTMMETKVDLKKGRLAIVDHSKEKAQAIVLVNLAPYLNDEDQVLFERVQLSLDLIQAAFDELKENA